MQLMLILGIAGAIAAVVFALQNNELVVVTLAVWRFEGSLAIVLLLALGLGVLITALLTTPAMIRAHWTLTRLRRQVAELQGDLREARGPRPPPAADDAGREPVAAEPAKSYVGLRTLLAGDDQAPPAG